ncbi:MAG: phosphate regulon transcriptional regulator PhoB [Pseudomonadota bacterium]
MSMHILVVDDEPAIRDMLSYSLGQSGYEVSLAEDVRAARRKLAERLPDLILLDWMMPEISGPEFARGLKKDEATKHIPIIMLTARDDEADKVRGLEIGADDYITKPFSTRELFARIKAVMRRVSPHAEEDLIEFHGLSIDKAGHRVTAGGQLLELGPTEFKLLLFFVTHPERVYTRSQLLDQVWGSGVYIEDRTVDVHIRRLRKALEPVQLENYVQTVRGTGYRFSHRCES